MEKARGALSRTATIQEARVLAPQGASGVLRNVVPQSFGDYGLGWRVRHLPDGSVGQQRQPRVCALVVDDIRDVAESLAKVLTAMGCDAVFLTDPRKALDEVRRLQPHIVFLDIGMPHMTGHEVARLLRSEFAHEKLKIVAVTAYDQETDRIESRKAGFDAHVAKPVAPEMVEAILRTVVPGIV